MRPDQPGTEAGQDQEARLGIAKGRSLADLATLELGGMAEYFLSAESEDQVLDAVEWATQRSVPITVIGGGSNVVIADDGVSGLVIRLATRGFESARAGDDVEITVCAGEDWDEVVARTVDEGWAGLECLSGIPGSAGATPIQNVGAYGQEVAERVVSVRAFDLETKEIVELPREACRFGYRSSLFRELPRRFVIFSLSLRVKSGGTPTVRYAELQKTLGKTKSAPSLAEVRKTVLELRRSKSMVIDLGDPNRRSVGSFFVNPVLENGEAKTLIQRAVDSGTVSDAEDMPRFVLDDGRVKIPAAWLIEKSGFARGYQQGHVGISDRHALALIHKGGGTTDELVALAASIRKAVNNQFGVVLRPEPVFLGFSDPDPL